MGIAGNAVSLFFLCCFAVGYVLCCFAVGYCIAMLYENPSSVSEHKSVDVASAEISVTRKNDVLSKAENFLSTWIVDPAVSVFYGAMNFTENCKLYFLNKKEQGTCSPFVSACSTKKDKKVRWKEPLCEYAEKSKSDFSYLVFSITESLDHQCTQILAVKGHSCHNSLI